MIGIKTNIRLDVPKQACEYIINNKGYIDTGILYDNSKIEMNLTPSAIGGSLAFWGSRLGNGSDSFTLFCQGNDIYYQNGKLTYAAHQDLLIANQNTTIVAYDGYIKVNDTVLTFTKQNFTTGVNIFLFTSAPNDYRRIAGKIYYCKIWNSDTLVRDFIPAYRTDTKEYVMFDKVEGKFYPSFDKGYPFTGKLE